MDGTAEFEEAYARDLISFARSLLQALGAGVITGCLCRDSGLLPKFGAAVQVEDADLQSLSRSSLQIVMPIEVGHSTCRASSKTFVTSLWTGGSRPVCPKVCARPPAKSRAGQTVTYARACQNRGARQLSAGRRRRSGHGIPSPDLPLPSSHGRRRKPGGFSAYGGPCHEGQAAGPSKAAMVNLCF